MNSFTPQCHNNIDSSRPQSNGRVDALHKNNLTQYDFFLESKKHPERFELDAVRYIHSGSEVANLFFSQKNIDILQDGIRFSVYSKTNNQYVIDKQSDTELKVVMRSIYLQYSKNLPDDLVSQVKSLNSKVLDYVVPRILSELLQHLQYVRDISSLPVPMERSQNMSAKGTRVLEINDF
jgi:hypothetical protein